MRSTISSSTLPLLPRTFPKRTIAIRSDGLLSASTVSSAIRLLAPMTLRAFAALSDEMSTSRAPASPAGARHRHAPEHVHAQRRQHVALQHRDVLVGCRMEHDLWRRGVDHSGHLRRRRHVGEKRPDGEGREEVAQLTLDSEEPVLRGVEQRELGGAHGGDRTGQLAPN